MTREKGRERADEVLAVLRDQIADVVADFGDDAEEAFLDRLLEGSEDFWINLISQRMAPRAIGNPKAVCIERRDIDQERSLKGGTWEDAFRRLIGMAGIDTAAGIYVEYCEASMRTYVLQGNDSRLTPEIQDAIRGEYFERVFNPPRRTRQTNSWVYA